VVQVSEQAGKTKYDLQEKKCYCQGASLASIWRFSSPRGRGGIKPFDLSRYIRTHYSISNILGQRKEGLMKKFFFIISLSILFVSNVYAAEYTMKVYNSLPPTFSGGMAGVELEKNLEKLSGGRIDVEYFHSSQLGREQVGLNQIQIGATQAGYISLVELTNQVKELTPLILPYLVRGWDDIFRFKKSDLSEEFLSAVKTVGLVGLTWDGYGWNALGTTKEAKALSDLTKFKFRITTSTYLIDVFKAMGPSPMVIPWPELYTALQQGTVDGTDHGIELVYLVKFNEVLKYHLETNHLYGWFMFVVNKAWYEKLPSDLQPMIKKVAEEASNKAHRVAQSREEEYFKKFGEGGGKITWLSASEREKFVRATKAVHDKYKMVIPKGLLRKAYDFFEYK
jgi:C4-dicarboxylate-binding protein DctP